MRNRFFAIAAIATLAIACNPYDDSTLVSRVDGLESKVEANSKAISDLQTALANAKGLTVTVTEVTGGYKVTFSDGSTFTVMNGKDGQNGKDGKDGADGAVGPQGPQGPAGKDGKDGKDGQGSVDFSIEETADSYIFTINGQTYTLGKTMDFALVLDKTSVNPVAGTPVEVPYTITGAAEGDEIHVFIAQAEGYTASVDEEKAVVTVEVPATLPEKGFVIVSAIDNTTGKQSSQYLSFVSGPSGILTVSYDAQPVPCEGGEIELNINTDADFEVVVPEGCNWITVSEVSTKADYKRYIVVAENTNTSSRQATLIVKTFSDSKEVVVSQAAYEAPKPTVDRPAGSILVLLEGTPAADEVLWSDLHAWLADESGAGETNPNADKLNGKTFFFPRATYEFPKKASVTFTSATGTVSINFVGDYATFVAAPTSSNTKNQRQHFSVKDYCNFTFENISFIDASASGNSNGASFWVGGASDAATASLTLKNCSFSNCTAGLGPCVFGKNYADMYLEGCTFSDCNGEGGAISTENSVVDINFTIKDCIFDGCSTSSYGGAIDGRAASDLIITGCTFTNCSNKTADALGSAIAVGSSKALGGKCIIDNCIFDGNSGSEVIAVNKSNGNVQISNCVFKNNKVENIGKIGASAPTGVIGAKIPFWISNCQFFDNDVESGSAIYAAGEFYADGLTIYATEASAAPIIDCTAIAFVGNSTIVAPSPYGLVYAGGDAAGVYNSLLFNTAENGTAIYEGTQLYLGGNNILGPVAGTEVDPSDLVVSAIDGGAWDAANAQYKWNGPASSFTMITPAGYQSAVEGFAGPDFYAWLESLGAFDYRGNAAAWWPGSYQK